MTLTLTPLQWRAYELTQPDHKGLSAEEAAKEMGVTEYQVKEMLRSMKAWYPDLFIDISSDERRFDHGVSRFGGWCEGAVKERF